jgi:uncharacterized protein
VEKLGTVSALRRYPVKSMAGEDLAEARVTFSGIVGDRVFAFLRKDNHSAFPWMTARLGHEMILFRPRFLQSPTTAEEFLDTEQFAVEVTTPEGEKFRMGEAKFTDYFEKRFNRPLKSRFSERSQTDARPISIFSLSTIRALSEEAHMQLDFRRFRANFYVHWENDVPFFEDQLVDRELLIGETVAIRVVKKDGRCVMITLDPQTAARAPVVLENVMRAHDGCAGVYAAVLREGIVRTNDPVFLGN